MDVGGWLRRLGLEQYEATFRENNVDETVLPSLTAEDLKDLGVGSVGHRRKLLDAIAALRAEASAPTPLSDAPLATDQAAKDTAERRQVTVMFSDLVGDYWSDRVILSPGGVFGETILAGGNNQRDITTPRPLLRWHITQHRHRTSTGKKCIDSTM
jgi:hypothetical protein